MSPSAPTSPARGSSLFTKLREELMSRSDTFDSDCDPSEMGSRSLPWISAPILQTTTCEALLDPRKLLCESSSTIAFLPCQKLGQYQNRSMECNESNNFQSNQNQSTLMEDLDVSSMNVIQGDLLSEVLTSANELKVLGEEEIKIMSPIEPASKSMPQIIPAPPKRNIVQQMTNNQITSDKLNTIERISEEPAVEINESSNVNDDAVEDVSSWNMGTDDSFKDVIDAINRLCDTISSASCKSNYTEEFCGKYTYHNDNLEPVESLETENYHDNVVVENLQEVIKSINSSTIGESPPAICTSPDILSSLPEFVPTDLVQTSPPAICTSPDILSSPPDSVQADSIQTSPPAICTSPDILSSPPDSVPIDLIQTSPVNSDTNNSLTCEAKEEFYSCEDIPNATDMESIINAPQYAYEKSVAIEDCSVADSSSPAVIEDDSSTNQTDLLQFSMCSSSWNNEDGGMCTSIDDHSPKSEEIPPPGLVAAMRMKFETFTSISPTAARMLKKPDDDYL